MTDVEKVVSIALGEVGYREKAADGSLDLAEANAGTGNWTKYARDLWNAGYYNGNKNGYEWCDVFVDWVFYRAFGKTEGQLTECQTGELGAACPYSASYYKAQGRYDKSPKVGDQVFFQQNGALVHTGIVIGVNGNTITCVEGNASNMVKQTSYSLSNGYVAGFGHPWYDDDTSAVTPAPAPEINIVSVQLPKLSRGATGSAAVKTVQRILYARGIHDDAGKIIKVDGAFGTSTKQAVIKLQKSLFPNTPAEWDGVVGQKTWDKMLTALW